MSYLRALLRVYSRMIEKSVTKIARFYKNQSTFWFSYKQINSIVKIVETCSRKGKKLVSLELLSKMVEIIQDENEFLEGKIFETLLDNGYILSM